MEISNPSINLSNTNKLDEFVIMDLKSIPNFFHPKCNLKDCSKKY